MHYLASDVVSFFLSPINWVFVLVVAAFFLRKASHKKICRIAALCIFIVFGNQWLLNWYANNWQPMPVAINNNIKYSCGIVPGGLQAPMQKEMDILIQLLTGLYKLRNYTSLE